MIGISSLSLLFAGGNCLVRFLLKNDKQFTGSAEQCFLLKEGNRLGDLGLCGWELRYPEYSLDTWSTDACGFIVKPLTREGVRMKLKKLYYPFSAGGGEA